MATELTLREKFLAATERKQVAKDINGTTVYLREMSAADRERMEARNTEAEKDGKEDVHYRARFLRYCLCDEQGNQLFTDADVPELAQRSSDVLIRLMHAALTINAVGVGAIADEKKD